MKQNNKQRKFRTIRITIENWQNLMTKRIGLDLEEINDVITILLNK